MTAENILSISELSVLDGGALLGEIRRMLPYLRSLLCSCQYLEALRVIVITEKTRAEYDEDGTEFLWWNAHVKVQEALTLSQARRGLP